MKLIKTDSFSNAENFILYDNLGIASIYRRHLNGVWSHYSILPPNVQERLEKLYQEYKNENRNSKKSR